MQDIYIGVDGGGTSTKTIIEDADGNTIGKRGVGGPANIKLSVEESFKSVMTSINDALEGTGISLQASFRFHIGLGLAGTELMPLVNEFLSLARQQHFASIKLESDAYTACVGAHGGEDGALIIIGTGSVGMAIQDGKKFQVGGWGFPHGDEGSGASIGFKAARYAFRSIDGRRETSPMLDAVRERFNNNYTDFLQWANDAKSTQYGQLAPIVFQHRQSDPNAIHILTKAASHINTIFFKLETARRNKQKIIPYSVFGGVSGPLTPYFCPELQNRLVSVKHEANKGAIIMLKKYMQKGDKRISGPDPISNWPVSKL